MNVMNVAKMRPITPSPIGKDLDKSIEQRNDEEIGETRISITIQQRSIDDIIHIEGQTNNHAGDVVLAEDEFIVEEDGEGET